MACPTDPFPAIPQLLYLFTRWSFVIQIVWNVRDSKSSWANSFSTINTKSPQIIVGEATLPNNCSNSHPHIRLVEMVAALV